WCRRTGTPYVINSESHGGGTAGRRDGGTAGRRDGATGRGGDPASGVPPSPRPLVAPSRRRLAAALKRFFVRRAAAGLPAGTLARDYLISLGGPAERMFFLPNTCPVDRFARESARARCRRAALR